MKVILAIVAATSLVSAAPQFGQQQAQNAPIPIVRQDQEVNFDASYEVNYETDNGIQAQQTGSLKNAGNAEEEAQVFQGSYSFIGPDGFPISITFIADENGYRAGSPYLAITATAASKL